MDITLNEFQQRPFRIIKATDIEHFTGLSRRQIFDLEKRGLFPKRIQLGARRVGWREDDIFLWQKERMKASWGTSPM